ncbi:type II toxin-antitoxin system ParD family antitoxin [Methylobacterium sp. WL120]|uniref:type II toxin-antitoxin system ParD family antitoxin n=1 Tax=Methylobacterium sp. WL120 TaxID=2603887 RepID=UPI0011C94BC1|nr:type II toxin-antitoxin system ParD family antitoxin [Methylobacterium sp. WL120]TXM70693.1 type II toxin-antitoxin system ParD family antitoxin [Methylobacterium sp. WL120]
MSSTPTRCIALTKELEAYLRSQVASGRYASASEVVRSALRLMIDREGAILVPRAGVAGPKAGHKSA